MGYKMNYTQRTKRDDNVRYVWEDGELKRKYVVLETSNGVYLSDEKVLNPSKRPELYYKDAVFRTEAEARG